MGVRCVNAAQWISINEAKNQFSFLFYLNSFIEVYLSREQRKICLENLSVHSSLKGQLKKETFQEPSQESAGAPPVPQCIGLNGLLSAKWELPHFRLWLVMLPYYPEPFPQVFYPLKGTCQEL